MMLDKLSVGWGETYANWVKNFGSLVRSRKSPTDYTDPTGTSEPVTYRLDDKREGTTQNAYFRDMVAEVNAWGLTPTWVTGECGDVGMANLKFLRNEKVGFLVGIADNRNRSLAPGKFVQVQTLTIPDGGLMAELKELGWVKVLCQNFKHEGRDYMMSQPDPESCPRLSRADFLPVHDRPWQIERFHRVIKLPLPPAA